MKSLLPYFVNFRGLIAAGIPVLCVVCFGACTMPVSVPPKAAVAAPIAGTDETMAAAPGDSRKVPSIGLVLIAVAPGTFVMGGGGGDPDELPATRVTITRPYWLGKFEVTQGEWGKLMDKNPSHFTGDLNLPVENIGYRDAQEFCRRLTEIESAAGRLPEKYVYRLPTEAEWEFAGRAGRVGTMVAKDEAAWFETNSGGKTHSVGTKAPNPWGFYDMQGNVWEMCFDRYADHYPGNAATDPVGLSSSGRRVNRGGGWSVSANSCRIGNRGPAPADFHQDILGFRIVLGPKI